MVKANIKGITLQLTTSPELFSPDHIDSGTLAMLACVEFQSTDKILDLGCGYGVVGIVAARIIGADNVVMSDVSEKAVAVSKENAVLNGVGGIKIILSDGFRGLRDKDFTLILSNPPYHADFNVPKRFIEKGFNRLAMGGKMYMVTKRRDWYKNKFITIFGGVQIVESNGYYVFCAERRCASYGSKN